MKKIILFAALGAAVMATSCTSEDNLNTQISNAKQAAISFQTNVALSRAVTTNGNLSEFTTTAYLKQGDLRTKFMDNVLVTKKDGVWGTEDTYMWPYNGTLSFFSVAPASLKPVMPAAADIDKTAPSFNFTAESEAAMQSDVIYAVNANHQYTGSDESSVVTVNFRHALAQIVFNAKCENANWLVDISDVKIHNAKSSGKYTLPLATTSALSSDYNVRGNWALNNTVNTYNTGLRNAKQNISKEVVELTSSTSLPLLLLPQTTQAWDPKNDPKCENGGTYFAIRCQLRQKTAEGDYAIIWPKSGADAYVDIAVPVAFDWEEGKKYTYTFNFKDGAGYIPPTQTGGGESVNPGKPVLNAITFNVAVDDFTTSSSDIKL